MPQRPKVSPAAAVKHDGPDAGLTGEVVLLSAGKAQKCWGGSSGKPLILLYRKQSLVVATMCINAH